MRTAALLTAILLSLSGGALCATHEFDLQGTKVSASTYIQADYSSSPGSSTFSVPRLRLDVWSDPTPLFGYLIELDPTVSPSIIYGWVDIKLSPLAKIRVGKFYYPFGLEYTTPPNKFDTINPSNTLWKYFGYSRDIGVQVLGEAAGLKYYLSVVNGNDNKPTDDNNDKDFCGRATYNFGNLTIGASEYWGKAGTLEANKGRTGAELKYAYGPFSLKGEFIAGLDGKVRSQGWYLMPIFRINQMFEVLVKYEDLDPDVDITENAQVAITPGLNIYFSDDVKWQINYVFNVEEKDQVNNDSFITQLQMSL